MRVAQGQVPGRRRRSELRTLKPHVRNDRICGHCNHAAHAIELPPNAQLLLRNGQVGARPDGTVPAE